MAVEIGDAILRFIGDTQQLDSTFDSLGAKAERGLQPATEALDGVQEGFDKAGEAGKDAADTIEEAGERTKSSMYAARGEVGLLGEAFGIHLPRHVRSFVAELPGVGNALSAAFSLTAVTFLIKALIEGAEKLGDFLAEWITAKSVWEESNKSIIDLNKQALALGKQYEELKKKADDYGKSALQLAQEHKGEVKESITELNKSLNEELAKFKELEAEISKHAKTVLTTAAAWEAYKSGNLSALQALKGWITGIDTAVLKHKQLDEAENKVITTGLKLKNTHQELRVATNNLATAQSDLNKKGAALDEQISNTANELNKMLIALNHIKEVEHDGIEIVTPDNVKTLLEVKKELSDLGVVLRDQLVAAYKQAQKAEEDYVAAGGRDVQVLKALHAAEQQRALDLKNFGREEQNELGKQSNLWKIYERDVVKAGSTTKAFTDLGKEQFQSFTNAVGTAFVDFANGTDSFGAALGKMAKSAIDALAAQSIGQAIYWTAMGLADTAVGNEAGATEAFAAATLFGEVAAVSGALALAAGAASGGGRSGSSQSTISQNSGQSFTSGSGVRGPVAVRGFADGGLVTGPTLALIGEKSGTRGEAVMSLDNPEALAKIGRAVAEAGGGASSGGLTVHVHGHVIGANDVAHLVGQINKRVQRGQVNLLSSNTLRITKRSA